jgi:Transmembrane domain of unknown function (DUF3566)
MSLTVPHRPARRPVDGDASSGTTPARLRLGALDLRSVLAYLLLWTLVLFVVEVLVLWSGHAALLRLGVLEQVSRAAATVLDQPLPETGLLPALELGALLPWLVAGAAGVAVLWLLTVVTVVLVHNAVCAVTGGPWVRVDDSGITAAGT